MPKIVSLPVKTHDELVTVKKLTEELNTSLRENNGGAVTTRIIDVMKWFGVSRNTAVDLLEGVNRVGKTKRYRTIDVARKIALDTVGGNIKAEVS